MKIKFLYEIIIGLLGLFITFFFGENSLYIITLFVFHPFIGKKQGIIKDYKFYYKLNLYTFIIFFLSLVFFFYYSDLSFNNYRICDLWLFLSSFILLTSHGLIGVLLFSDYNVNKNIN